VILKLKEMKTTVLSFCQWTHFFQVLTLSYSNKCLIRTQQNGDPYS